MANLADRDDYENQIIRRLAALGLLAEIMRTLGTDMDVSNLTAAFWGDIEARIRGIVTTELFAVFRAAWVADEAALGYTFPAEYADRWLQRNMAQYGADLARQITLTQQTAVEHYVGQYFDQQWSQGQLRGMLEPFFGAERAALIARTEVTRAASNATGAVQEQLKRENVQTRQIWRTREDELVCPICGRLRNKLQGIDWELPPPAHPRCILPGNEIVVPGRIQAATTSYYVGRCIEVTFGSGSTLAVTAHHPILTRRGWVFAGELKSADQLIRAIAPERIVAAIYPEDDYVPTRIEQIVNTLMKSSTMTTRRMPVSAEDFYGDGSGFIGEIDIVFADSFLLDERKPVLGHSLGDNTLNVGNIVPGSLQCFGSQQERFGFHRNASSSLVSSHHLCAPLLFGHVSPLHQFSVGLITRDNATRQKPASESPAIDPRLAGEFVLRFAREIAMEQIIQIRDFDFSGHVYDLQVSPYELYICNSIITHNCRCWPDLIIIETEAV